MTTTVALQTLPKKTSSQSTAITSAMMLDTIASGCSAPDDANDTNIIDTSIPDESTFMPFGPNDNDDTPTNDDMSI